MGTKAAVKFLIGLVVLGLVLWCVWMLLGLFPLPYPLPQIVMVIMFLVFLGFVLNRTGYWPD